MQPSRSLRLRSKPLAIHIVPVDKHHKKTNALPHKTLVAILVLLACFFICSIRPASHLATGSVHPAKLPEAEAQSTSRPLLGQLFDLASVRISLVSCSLDLTAVAATL